MLFFCASLCTFVYTRASTPYYSFQGWDSVMCRTSALPVDDEGSAVGLHWHFLRASGRHPVCQLHTAAWVGCQERHCHWLCRWHHTGKLDCLCVCACWEREREIITVFKNHCLATLCRTNRSAGEVLLAFIQYTLRYSNMPVITLALALQVAAWMSIEVLVTAYGLCVRCVAVFA